MAAAMAAALAGDAPGPPGHAPGALQQQQQQAAWGASEARSLSSAPAGETAEAERRRLLESEVRRVLSYARKASSGLLEPPCPDATAAPTPTAAPTEADAATAAHGLVITITTPTPTPTTTPVS